MYGEVILNSAGILLCDCRVMVYISLSLLTQIRGSCWKQIISSVECFVFDNIDIVVTSEKNGQLHISYCSCYWFSCPLLQHLGHYNKIGVVTLVTTDTQASCPFWASHSHKKTGRKSHYQHDFFWSIISGSTYWIKSFKVNGSIFKDDEHSSCPTTPMNVSKSICPMKSRNIITNCLVDLSALFLNRFEETSLSLTFLKWKSLHS